MDVSVLLRVQSDIFHNEMLILVDFNLNLTPFTLSNATSKHLRQTLRFKLIANVLTRGQYSLFDFFHYLTQPDSFYPRSKL